MSLANRYPSGLLELIKLHKRCLNNHALVNPDNSLFYVIHKLPNYRPRTNLWSNNRQRKLLCKMLKQQKILTKILFAAFKMLIEVSQQRLTFLKLDKEWKTTMLKQPFYILTQRNNELIWLPLPRKNKRCSWPMVKEKRNRGVRYLCRLPTRENLWYLIVRMFRI